VTRLAGVAGIGILTATTLFSRSEPFYFLTYAVVAVLAIGSVWAWFQTGSLHVDFTADPAFPQAGDPLVVKINLVELRGMARSAVAVAMVDDLGGRDSALSPEEVIDIPHRGLIQWNVTLSKRRRGLNQVGPLVIDGSDPLGFRRHRRRIGGSQQILVHPKTFPLPDSSLASFGDGGRSVDGALQGHGLSASGRVREYSTSDPLSHIHWPTTARLGRLMTMEFEDDNASNMAWIVLDLQEDVQAGAGEESTEEYGVAIAASLAMALLDADLPVALIAAGRSPINLAPGSGLDRRTELLDALAYASAGGDIPIFDLLEDHRSEMRSGGQLFVVTPSEDPRVLEQLKGLGRSGVGGLRLLLHALSFDRVGTSASRDDVVPSAPEGWISCGDDLGASVAAILDKADQRRWSTF